MSFFSRLLWRRDKAAVEAAKLAREKAEEELARTRAETPKYQALGRSLREMRERNHLGEALTNSFRSNHE